MRDHTPITIDEFNGLWRRGDVDSVPMDHFSDVNNISFIESGFKTRDGLDTFLNKGNLIRIYTFNTHEDGLLILDSNGDFYHIVGSGFTVDSITLILHLADVSDFKFVNINNRAYIDPLTGADEFIYVYNGDQTMARKAAGLPPVNADGALAVANSAVVGNVEAGIHIFGVVYETNSGFLSQIGPDTLPTLNATGAKEADLTNIPISPSSFVIARHIVVTRAIDPSDYTGNTRGYEFFFVPNGIISDNTSTSLSVSFFDADLLEDASNLFDLLTEIPKSGGLTVYHNRLISHGENDPNTALIRVSNPGEPESISALDGLILLPNNGNGLTNSFVYRDVLYITKINQTFAIVDNGDVPSSWPVTVIDNGIGAGIHAVVVVGNENDAQSVEFVAIFDQSGIYLFNGTFAKPELSYKIKDYWLESIALSHGPDQFYNDPIHQIIYINIPSSNTILIGDYSNGLNPKQIRWSKWTFDIEPTSITLFNKINNLILGSRFGTIISTYSLIVVSGTGDGTYQAGTVITITADPPPFGQLFDQWTGGTVTNASNPITTITMPAGSLTLTATYLVPAPVVFHLVINFGTGDGLYQAGTNITIVADAPATGKVFAAWTGGSVTNPTNSTTTFVMPAVDSVLTATYSSLSYSLIVGNGSGDGLYIYQQVVTIVADPPPSGQAFLAWTGATVANANSSTTTLTMPASNASVTATYVTISPTLYTLSVVSGSGDGSYVAGTIVTIVADAPPMDQQFNVWTGGTVANPFGSTTTTIMPAGNVTLTATYEDIPVIDAELIIPSDLIYEGAFRLPQGIFNSASFAYGGYALSYYAPNNSLYLSGYGTGPDALQAFPVAEIGIPEGISPINTTIASLPTATFLQTFVDAFEGRIRLIGPNASEPAAIGGTLPYSGKLILDSFGFYDAENSVTKSHFVSGLTIGTTGDIQGPYQVWGPGVQGFIDGYMTTIPTAWQTLFGGPVLTGNAALSIISRTSLGPAAFVIDPANLGLLTPLPATPLVYYPINHPTLGLGDTQGTDFNQTCKITGIAFPIGKRSVLFFGTYGHGPYCYGTGAECGDPANPAKGVHMSPYTCEVWAYDVLDLLDVKNAVKQPWEIVPYLRWSITLPFANLQNTILGAAYDQATTRLYISQLYGEASIAFPLIHVFSIPLPVVPGARGFGMNTRAAYGGSVAPTVYRVTNLNDSGAGSLRAAAEALVPRIVIFEISGTIPAVSEIVITGPYCTIAGQTAPSPGITLKSYGIQIQTHDVLIQHIRIRPGGDTCNTGVEAFQTGNPYNIILDHLSVSWSQSKNFVFTNSAHDMNLTVWRCICSEPLYAAPGTGSCSGGGFGYAYGMLFRNNAKKACVIQTLFAHNSERNPELSGSAQAYSANNYIYDWQTLATLYEDPDGVEPPGLLASHIGNVYKTGPSTTPTRYLYGSRYLATGAKVYIADTLVDSTGDAPIGFTVINGDGIDPQVSTPPIVIPSYTPVASNTVPNLVLQNSGARPLDRDSVDTRIISEVINRTGHLIATQAEVGGWPVLAVNVRALTLPADPNTVTPSGYTNLELWLHTYANELEP